MHRSNGAAELCVLVLKGLRQLFGISRETLTEVQEVALCFSCSTNRSSLNLAKRVLEVDKI